jgi:hypothetical protein
MLPNNNDNKIPNTFTLSFFSLLPLPELFDSLISLLALLLVLLLVLLVLSVSSLSTFIWQLASVLSQF